MEIDHEWSGSTQFAPGSLYKTVMEVTKNVPYSHQLFCEGEIDVGMFKWELAFDNADEHPVIEWVWATSAVNAVKEFLTLHEHCHFFTVRLTSDNE
jgi:hypothetical protein